MNASELESALSALTLCEQNDELYSGALDTAAKLLANVFEHPAEPKYRRVRTGNKTLRRKLLNVGGGAGKQLLLAAGFNECVEDDEHYLILRTTQDPTMLASTLASLRAAQLNSRYVAKSHRVPARTLVATRNTSSSVPVAVKVEKEPSSKASAQLGRVRPAAKEPSRSYVRRTAPSAAPAAKKLNMRKLHQKWLECKELLRDVDVSSEASFETMCEHIDESRAFLMELEQIAEQHDSLQGDLIQQAEVVNGVVPRDVLEQIAVDLAELRALLRIKIADDADLDTTRAALNDVKCFLLSVGSYAERKGVTPFVVMENLLNAPF